MIKIVEHPSPNHGPRRGNAPIDILLLHYTEIDRDEALERLCDPEAQVSAHYVIDEDGTIYRLVPEARRAWHAGRSHWGGDDDVNSRSIGIELVNPGDRPFAEAQMAALEGLCHDILSRHPIPRERVLGHSDVAPGRKIDPGPHFDWQRLAAAGIGYSPVADLPEAPEPVDDIDALTSALAAFGYGIEDLDATVAAFHLHWRPEAEAADAATLALAQTLADYIGVSAVKPLA